MTIPKEIHGQKYISLTTLRKNGEAVKTPVWFAEHDGKLYVKTRSDSGKYKRIRNNPQVGVAACTVGGKIIGSEFSATARVLPAEDWQEPQNALHRKYWLSRLPFWSKKNVFVEIAVAS